VEAHRRRPVAAVLVLTALAFATDVVRASTGVAAVGFANLLFVWLLVQQLGFWLASGALDRLGRRGLALLAATAVAAVVAGAGCGLWSLDLYADLNPPATALAFVGVAQLAVFQLLRPRLRRAAARPLVSRMVGAMNRRAMTVYAWHMLALIPLAGLLLASGIALPAPLSGEWWATRPLWLVATFGVVAAVVALASRAEAAAEARDATATAPAHGTARALAAAACGAGGVLTVLVAGSLLAGWVAGAALVLAALRIARRTRSREPLSR
jgi:hypothetical protein